MAVHDDRITRRELLKAGLLTGVIAGAASAAQLFGPPPGVSQPPLRRGDTLPWPEARRILADTVVPTFPDAVHMVTDDRYGAVGDGVTDNTLALKTAIEACSSRGGGRVVVPAGVYVTGAIRLLANVDLHLEDGAVLMFSGNPDDYPLVLTRYEGIECMNRSPMIYAYGQTNIGLSGEGVLDAAGTTEWNAGADRAGILEPLVDAGVPPEQRIVPERGGLRSAFVEPYRCSNVLIEGVTLRHSQFWQLHPTLCRNVTVGGVTTRDATHPNTDGCNPESCDHVVIRDSTLSAGDDCIGIKSGRDADGRRVAAPCQNVVILGCKLQGPAAGIACGSEMTGGIQNVYAFDVDTFGESVLYALYVKSNTRRGGCAQNVNLDSFIADHVRGAWAFAQMDYDGQSGGHPPSFGAWSISNSGGDFAPVAFRLSGLAGDAIHDVRVRDCQFNHVEIPFDMYDHVDGVTFDRVTINGRSVSS